MPPTLRRMVPEDAPAVHEVTLAAFDDLARRLHETPDPPPDPALAHLRLTHLVRTDPDGAWVAENETGVCGVALALVREGVWGLSLLVVHPEEQSGGVGRALLERALATAQGTRGQIILASPDTRAIRAYARAGFDLHPAVGARGRPNGVGRPACVERGGPDDLPLTGAVDRTVRGAAREQDVAAMLMAGNALEVVPERGYVVHHEGTVRALAARDPEAAADLLRAAMAATPPGREAVVEPLTAAQQWAVRPVLEAGLPLRPWGPVFLRGDVGPFAPYVPSGAYL